MVENLLDFPDQIGKKIFDAAKAKDAFYSFANSTHIHAMQMFCDAYREDVLVSMDLSRKPWIHWVAQDLLPKLTMFKHVVKLDISGCQLGQVDNAMQSLSKFVK